VRFQSYDVRGGGWSGGTKKAYFVLEIDAPEGWGYR
jgi:hypothetical protein